MKKIIIGLAIVGLLVSFSGVEAKTRLSDAKINAVVTILRSFQVEQSKIDAIVKILSDGKETPKPKRIETIQKKLPASGACKGCSDA